MSHRYPSAHANITSGASTTDAVMDGLKWAAWLSSLGCTNQAALQAATVAVFAEQVAATAAEWSHEERDFPSTPPVAPSCSFPSVPNNPLPITLHAASVPFTALDGPSLLRTAGSVDSDAAGTVAVTMSREDTTEGLFSASVHSTREVSPIDSRTTTPGVEFFIFPATAVPSVAAPPKGTDGDTAAASANPQISLAATQPATPQPQPQQRVVVAPAVSPTMAAETAVAAGISFMSPPRSSLLLAGGPLLPPPYSSPSSAVAPIPAAAEPGLPPTPSGNDRPIESPARGSASIDALNATVDSYIAAYMRGGGTFGAAVPVPTVSVATPAADAAAPPRKRGKQEAAREHTTTKGAARRGFLASFTQATAGSLAAAAAASVAFPRPKPVHQSGLSSSGPPPLYGAAAGNATVMTVGGQPVAAPPPLPAGFQPGPHSHQWPAPLIGRARGGAKPQPGGVHGRATPPPSQTQQRVLPSRGGKQ